MIIMNKQEKEIVKVLVSDLKKLQETVSKNELVEFIDTNIIMRSYLDHSDEFMEKLYFIRYYYNIGKKFI